MLPTLLTLTTLCLLGCKDDPEDTGPDDTGTGDGGTEIDVLAIYVYDPNTAALDPVEGVTVAFDTTDGERLEAVSGADGFAAVELDVERFSSAIAHADGSSFSVVTAAAVVPGYKPGYVLAMLPSWSLGEEVSLPVRAGSGWTTVSGALLNMVDAQHSVVASATTASEWFLEHDGPASYALDVPTGQDFTIVALEFEEDENWGDDRLIGEVFHSWVVIDQPAISEAATVDIDFGDAVVPNSIVGSIQAPTDTILAEQGFMYINVLAGGAYSGFSHTTSPGADGASYDFQLEYVDVAGIDPTTQVQVFGPDGSFSQLWLQGGLPSEGAQDLGLLSPPRRTAPSGEGPFPWDQSITYTPSADVESFLFYFSEWGQLGVVYTGADETQFALPPLPSTSTTLTSGEITAIMGSINTVSETVYVEAFDLPFYIDSPFAP